MSCIVVRHRVANYAKWKPVFDAHEEFRRQSGWISHAIHRDPSDPNMVVVIGRVKDLKRAKDFLRSDSLRSAMLEAGVQGEPETWLLEDEEDRRY